jgi:hypothetical protein
MDFSSESAFSHHEKTCYIIGAKNVGKKTLSALLNKIVSLLRLYIFVKGEISGLQNHAVKFIVSEDISSGIETNSVIFLVFDITNEQSLNRIKSMKASLSTIVSSKLFLIGNKMDLEYWRRVRINDAVECADSLHTPYWETSLLTGQETPVLAAIVISELMMGSMRAAPKEFDEYRILFRVLTLEAFTHKLMATHRLSPQRIQEIIDALLVQEMICSETSSISLLPLIDMLKSDLCNMVLYAGDEELSGYREKDGERETTTMMIEVYTVYAYDVVS